MSIVVWSSRIIYTKSICFHEPIQALHNSLYNKHWKWSLPGCINVLIHFAVECVMEEIMYECKITLIDKVIHKI